MRYETPMHIGYRFNFFSDAFIKYLGAQKVIIISQLISGSNFNGVNGPLCKSLTRRAVFDVHLYIAAALISERLTKMPAVQSHYCAPRSLPPPLVLHARYCDLLEYSLSRAPVNIFIYSLNGRNLSFRLVLESVHYSCWNILGIFF